MTKAVLIKDFPDDVHKKARHLALEEEISLRDLIVKAVDAYVKKAEKKGGK